jgi:hypothetical protein
VSVDNPWREFIENVIDGSNYFRASEYRDLLADLDRGYEAQAELVALEESAKNDRLVVEEAYCNEKAAKARLAAVEADAKRYRWLRDSATTGDWCELGGMTAERMEADIDAFLSAAPAGGCTCGSITSQQLFGGHEMNCPRHGMTEDQPEPVK